MSKNKSARRDGLVYSTGPSPIDWNDAGRDARTPGGKGQNSSAKDSQREAVVRIEKSGRKGKTVTVIELRGVGEDEAKVIGKTLKNACGVGGTTKETVVELQGDQRERLRAPLEKESFRVRGM